MGGTKEERVADGGKTALFRDSALPYTGNFIVKPTPGSGLKLRPALQCGVWKLILAAGVSTVAIGEGRKAPLFRKA
jgi:hypothetical protein